MDSMLNALGRACAVRPWLTITSWLVVTIALLGLGQAAGGTFVNDFRVPGVESQKATDEAQDHFPSVGAVTAQVVAHAPEGELDSPGRAAAVNRMLDRIRSQSDVNRVNAPVVGENGKAMITDVSFDKDLGDLDATHYQRLDEAADPARGTGLDVEFRGMVIDLGTEPTTGGSELVGVGAALIVLIIAFGSLVAAGLPLAVATIGILAGTALVLLVGSIMAIPTSAPIIATMLGLGAGIDYALFILSRFRNNLANGESPPDAAGHASAVAGHAVVFAGGTVVIAILGLNLAGIPFVGAMGIAAAITVAVMMVAALTLLPALLGLLGHRVNSLPLPRLRPTRPVSEASHARGGHADTRAGRLGGHVYRNRVVYACSATVVLLALSAPLLSLRLGNPDDGTQPPELTQRKAYDLIAENFGPGWNAPLVVTVTGAEKGGAEKLSAALGKDPEVAQVTLPQHSENGQAALLTVVPKHAPQDEDVSSLVHRIRDDTAPRALASTGGEALVGGSTALQIDMTDVIAERLAWVVLAVVGAGTLLLVAMFRAPVVALKAAFMALLSIGVSFGVVTAMFQWGWGLDLIGVDKTVPIASPVPMLMFAVLFGLSMDYEVFLLSSVREAYDRTRGPRQAVIEGLSSTAGVITAAAAIMTCVFLSFVAVPDTLIKIIGVGLAAAVIIDATVIRMVLVPATMAILGHWAWWQPGKRRPTSGRTSVEARAAEPEDDRHEQDTGQTLVDTSKHAPENPPTH
ncbi:MMPL family transporter [Streptomyces sp. AJS327]|uniref:MMPL family transporter n=1 Tax=Streptomyces sp. AJS327 TaxID=2545265 RepID=UPI0015DF296F|nr:MMPL family transporter [Streptomyces sp. AJS327]MBA0050645.1 MMPL family transporter [Streptomyces sp. AJS327]